nr:aminodeoxychorismate synthase component I [uncultured Sphingorhabdus sp.]
MMPLPTDAPFVLLDDARKLEPSPSRLYVQPVRILTAQSTDDIAGLMADLRQAKNDGLHAAGYLAYDAGAAFLPTVPARSNSRLAWFGLFDSYQLIPPDVVASLLPDSAGAWLSPLRPDVSRSDYGRAFAKVQDYINAGDIYQANLTFPLSANYAGCPLALYAALRGQAKAGYGGIIATGDAHYLSYSPELFFALKGSRVTTKPMKGTAKRHADLDVDRALAETLRTDPKQRAENLMIVDLLRNDLSRVCAPGSVEVPALFHIESYPTVHQMTSTVTGQLNDNADAVDVIAALFPCGSITGAPKIRAMQVIDEIEDAPRGIYCGSIGRIDNDGSAAFNVAIRTFTLCEKTKSLSFGLGSGVVADSVEASEWDECLAKGDFTILHAHGFDLIETMRFEPMAGILRLEDHLDRMHNSARLFGFEFDRHELRNRLHASIFHLHNLSKIRLMLSKTGAMSVEIRPLNDVSYWRVAVVPLPVPHDDFRLRHKITDRAFYDDARKARPDCDEVIFVGADGRLTEGSITALFVERGDLLLTPRLETGLLPSVLRAELIASGKAKEADLTIADLHGEFYVGNSLRGLIRAKWVA